MNGKLIQKEVLCQKNERTGSDGQIFRHSLVKGSAIGLSACPPILLVIFLRTYAVNIPFLDQWNIIYLFEKYYSHQLSFLDFFQQHNEHRILFPKIVFLLLGICSRYNVLWEMAFSLFLALIIYLTMVVHVNRNKEVFRVGRERYFLWIVFSTFCFSLIQWENWFWGFQLQWFLNLLAVVVGGYLFSNYRLNSFVFGGLAICGTVATFSLSSGILFWVILLIFMAFYRLKRPSEKTFRSDLQK